MKQHHNSGATSWASLASSPSAADTVVKLKAQPDGIDVYVAVTDDEAKAAKLLDVYLSAAGVPFFTDAVQRWHARELGQNVVVGNAQWDRHPAYKGPEDTVVYAYSLTFERRPLPPPPAPPAPTTTPEVIPVVAEEPPALIEAPKPRPRVKKVAAPTGQATVAPRVTRSKKRV